VPCAALARHAYDVPHYAMKRFRLLALATAVATLLLIAWGGVVRTTGSGDGCPDWPKCYGRWIPRFEYHTLIEYVHRLLAVISGTLSIALAVVAIVALVRSRRGHELPMPRSAAWLAVSLAPLFAIQGAIGGWIIASHEDPQVVTLHFAVAFVVLGISVAIATLATMVRPGTVSRADRGYARLTVWGAGATYLLLLVGTYVRAEGAGLAFRDWPLMGGRLIPSFGPPGALDMFVHRTLALVVTALLGWQAVRARTMRPRVATFVRLSTLALVFVLAEVALGGLNVVTELATVPRALHVADSALIWASVVALAVAARLRPDEERPPADAGEGDVARGAAAPGAPAGSGPSMRDTISAYVALTKPRIIVLLLITTVPAMVLAAHGMPSIWLILLTLAGGTLAAGAANAINMYLDRDIDQVMRRTRQRPLPRHRVEPESALRFGFVLAAISFAFLAYTVNVLAALLALSAIAFYVFVYTMWLKRTSTQNIVVGGAAGAVPVLVGWAAVTGTLALPAWVLFAVVFVWTPPHFWALAMKVQDDYAAAGIPMLPVVRGEAETRRQIFLYSLVLFGVTLLLVPVGSMGPVYTTTAVVLGGIFVGRALQLYREPSDARAWDLFKFSVLYLAALFGSVAIDALVR
jgi:protoheme IX farnesyltransferase